MIVVWLKHYYSTINSSSLSYHLKTRAIRMTDRTQRWRNTTLRRAVRGEVRAQPSHGVMDVDEGCCDTSTSLPCLPVACTCTNKAAVHTLIDKLLSQGSRVLWGWDQLFDDHAEVFGHVLVLLWLMFDGKDASVSTSVLFKHGTCRSAYITSSVN